MFRGMPFFGNNCSQIVEQLLQTCVFHSIFLPDGFLLEHSFDFTSRKTFSRLILKDLNCVHSEMKPDADCEFKTVCGRKQFTGCE